MGIRRTYSRHTPSGSPWGREWVSHWYFSYTCDGTYRCTGGMNVYILTLLSIIDTQEHVLVYEICIIIYKLHDGICLKVKCPDSAIDARIFTIIFVNISMTDAGISLQISSHEIRQFFDNKLLHCFSFIGY